MAKQWSKPPEMQIDPGKKYRAHMETDKGTMVIELFADKAPRTVNNFVFLARDGFAGLAREEQDHLRNLLGL